MTHEFMKDRMQDLSCERFTVPQGGDFYSNSINKEAVLHVMSGKCVLIVGPQGGQQWRYPLDAYDTVWIPSNAEYTLQNDGVGNLELARFHYSA